MESNEIESSDEKISIFYEKNPHYRTIYSDGVIGGVTPHQDVNISFFATRLAIPKAEYYKVSEGVIEEIIGQSSDSKKGFIREIEVGVYMTKNTAKDLYNFLKNIFENE